MSAILLGRNPLESMFDSEEVESKQDDDKEQIIKGKNKTYVISKTLGKGTFGKVKLAYNQENKNEKYACKILLKSNIKDKDDNIRCKREMEILKKMHHVNVVRTYEIISTETTFYIFMDYCSKGELFNYIVDKHHLSPKKSAFFYYQLINGIEYLHKKGVCHRDLKPENLLLTEKNKLKIIDFGLSNYYNVNLLETPCGSPCYASPEMVRGHKYDGFRIDIWSSGIILYAMLCGYLPFEEMENDECNEVLFKNIMECNVEYPPEFIPPYAESLLRKIIVKDPRKRITIDEIKKEKFYILGEIIYKQTFENLKNIGLDEYLFSLEDNNKLYKYLKDDSKDNLLEKNYLYFNDNNKKETEKVEIIKYTEPNMISEKYKNEFITLLETEENKIKKKLENYEKGYLLEQIKKKNSDKVSKLKLKKEYIDNKENIFSQKINYKLNSSKKDKSKDLQYLDNKYKKFPDELLSNIPLLTYSNERNNNLENILNYKNANKKTKDNILKQEYSVQDDIMHQNNNFNSKDINMKNYYLKTELDSNNFRDKINIKKLNYKLTKKNKEKNNRIVLGNIMKVLQNRNTQKNKTLKPYSNKINNIATKSKNNTNNNQPNSLNKKKYYSYSPGIKKINKKGINLINTNDKNIQFPRQNNYFPLTTHENSNNYNMISNDIMKYFNSNHFLKSELHNINNKNKNIKLNNNFPQYKDIKSVNNLNTFNNENYFRINNNIKNKNNDENKLIKNSINNALNIKSFELYLKTNNSKRNNPLPEPKFPNNINIKKGITENNNIYNNINIIKNTTANNNLNKKSLGNLKGSAYLETFFNESSKPILINSNISNKNPEINNRNTRNLSTNKKIENNKIRILSNNNSKSKNKNKNKNHSLSHKVNHIYIKDNIDNKIIINFNILKPNIILENKKLSSRKLKTNTNTNNKGMNNNIILNKIERPITESNICTTVRNNLMNKSEKNRMNNFKNYDIKHIKKTTRDINKIIKSINEFNKK